MFTQQVELLNGIRGLPPEQAIERLIDMIPMMVGNCVQELIHRGQIAIKLNGLNNPPDVPATETGDVYQPLKIENPNSTYDLTTNTIFGGLVQDNEGVTRVRKCRGQNNPLNRNICLLVQDGMVVQDLYVTNIYNTGGTPFGVDVEVVTDVQFTGTTFQKKTRTVTVLATTAASAWTTWHTCSTLANVMTAASFSDPNLQQTRTADVVVLSNGAAATTTWHACVNEDYVKDVGFSSPTFQQNKRNAVVLKLGTATGLTTYFTCTTMANVMTDTDYSSPNLRKAQTTSVVVLGIGSAGSLTTYTTADAC